MQRINLCQYPEASRFSWSLSEGGVDGFCSNLLKAKVAWFHNPGLFRLRVPFLDMRAHLLSEIVMRSGKERYSHQMSLGLTRLVHFLSPP